MHWGVKLTSGQITILSLVLCVLAILSRFSLQELGAQSASLLRREVQNSRNQTARRRISQVRASVEPIQGELLQFPSFTNETSTLEPRSR